MEKEQEVIEVHEASGQSLEFWKVHGNMTNLVISDGRGYISIQVTKEDWIKIREKLDGLFSETVTKK